MTTIQITQEVIDTSKPCSFKKCMLANGITNYLQEGYWAEVGFSLVGIWNKNQRVWFGYLPDEAVRARMAFDSEHRPNPTPFSFELDLPEEYLQPIPYGWDKLDMPQSNGDRDK